MQGDKYPIAFTGPTGPVLVMTYEWYAMHRDPLGAMMQKRWQDGYRAILVSGSSFSFSYLIQLYLFESMDDAMTTNRQYKSWSTAAMMICENGDIVTPEQFAERHGVMPPQEESKEQQFVNCKAEAAEERPIKFREFL